MTGKSVLFDLDGTLTDPKPGITRCIVHALDRMGCAPVDPDALGWCIGPPLRGSFARLLETDNAASIAEAIAHYRERFSEVGLFENEVYAGIPEVLTELREAGNRLYVATSKPEVFALRIVERFGLAHFFEGIVGSELDGTREPKAEVIAHLLTTFGIGPNDAVMVGDRMHDVIGAHQHGLPCVGVLFGYGESGELEAAGAWPLCDSPGAIPSAVASCRHRSAVIP